MTKTDTPLLATQLNALAEVFDKRTQTPAAVQVWMDTLREFPTERVLGLLIAWPKSHGKFPTPNDAWKILNEQSIDNREQRAAEEKVRREYETGRMVSSEQGRKIIAGLMAGLSRARRSPRYWAHKIIDRAAAGEDVIWIALAYAREALGLDPKTGLPKAERVPGEDDEAVVV